MFERLSTDNVEVELLCDAGTATCREDILIVNSAQGLVGVVDGVSEFYSPSQPQQWFNGYSGGQIVAQVIQRTVEDAECASSLMDVVRRANQNVADCLRELGYQLDTPEKLPGAAAGLLKFDFHQRTLEVIGWADTLVIWRTRSGDFGGTLNQTSAHDRQMAPIVASLMRKYDGDRGKMWDDYLPIALPFRHHRINNSFAEKRFALLNGQPAFMELIGDQPTHLACDSLEHLVVFSDGCLPLQDSQDPVQVARRFFSRFRDGGLRAVLQETRQSESRQSGLVHTDSAEATAVSIRWCW